MIEYRARPRGGAMAGFAGARESRGSVIGIRRSVIIRRVAVIAYGRREAVVVIEVALSAGDGRVGAGQRKAGGRVIERRAGPICRGMAQGAILRESRRRMRGIGRAVPIRSVAGIAGAGGQSIVVVRVTLRAGDRDVRARQCEPRACVIKR